MAKKKKNIKNKGNDKKKMISNFPSKKEEKAVVDGVVEYEEGITVDELSQKIGQTPANVIKVLFMLGKFEIIFFLSFPLFFMFFFFFAINYPPNLDFILFAKPASSTAIAILLILPTELESSSLVPAT